MLSDEQSEAIYYKVHGHTLTGLGDFARAIEAEVRKQDTDLIRAFVAAIKLDQHDSEDWPEDSRKAFEALCARLGEKGDSHGLPT